MQLIFTDSCYNACIIDNDSNEEEPEWKEIADSDEELDNTKYSYKEEWGPGNVRAEDIPARLPLGSGWVLIGGVCTRYKKKKIKK